MSGPMAASFGLEAGVLLAAQSILQGAAEIAAGLGAADRQAVETQRQRQAERLAQRQQRSAAQQANIEKQQRMGMERAARLRGLLAAWQGLGQAEDGGDIDLPAITDGAAHAAYLTALDTRIARLETLLADAAKAQGGEVAAALTALLASGVSAQEQFAAFFAQARLAGVDADSAAARQQQVAHVLERLALAADEPLPAALDALGLAIVQAPTAARAAALTTELRLRVQTFNTERAAAVERQRLQEAAAVVLEQSLKDLGYAVEEIEATLFVEGGIAHFQRPEWGDYFIRLRLDPRRNAMNFNVVRSGTVGADRQREDMLAEERWCSEFPRLFETLKARGIPIAVTRLLQAGEAPVQVVSAASLPASARGEEWRQSGKRLLQLPR